MPTVLDDFNRANASPVGGNWATGTGDLAFNLVSNALVPSALNNDCCSIYTATTFADNQSSKAKLTVTGVAGGGQGGGLCVRHAPAAKTYYRWVIDHIAAGNAELGRFNAGTYTALDSRTQTFVNNDEFEFRITGSVGTILLAIYRNGALAYSINDTSGSGIQSGSPGIAYSSTVTAFSADDWTGTDEFGATFNKTGSGIVGP